MSAVKLRDRHGHPAGFRMRCWQPWDEEKDNNRHWEKERWLDWMGQSLEELAKEQKLCVILFYLDKNSYQDIAMMTGFTLMQVKSYIQNGKRNLRLLMEKKAREKAS